jgi:hypothetical protein
LMRCTLSVMLSIVRSLRIGTSTFAFVPAIARCSIQHFRLQQQTVSVMIAGGIAAYIYSLKDLKHTEKYRSWKISQILSIELSVPR